METKVQEQARVVSSLMAKIVQSAANVAEAALDDMTTDWEKKRLDNIRKNNEQLAAMDIAAAAAELKIVQSPANVAETALDDMTTDWEKKRLDNIRKNNEQLAAMDIAAAAAELNPKRRATAATTRRSKPTSSGKARRSLKRQAKTAGRARAVPAANDIIAAASAEAVAVKKATAVAVSRRKMKIFDAKVSDDAKFTTADVAAFPWYVHPKHTHMGPC